MKKLLLTTFVLLAIGGTTMAQTKKTAKGKTPLTTRLNKPAPATEAEKMKQAETMKAAPVNTVTPAAMTVETEMARKKAGKSAN